MPFNPGDHTTAKETSRLLKEAEHLDRLLDEQNIINLHLSEMSDDLFTEEDIECA